MSGFTPLNISLNRESQGEQAVSVGVQAKQGFQEGSLSGELTIKSICFCLDLIKSSDQYGRIFLGKHLYTFYTLIRHDFLILCK